MSKEKNCIVGLDIGTTKICAIVGEVNSKTQEFNIVGVGTHPSYGLKRGVVVNIDNTIQSINSAVGKAEHMAGCEIRTVFVGIAGGHIKGITSNGMVTIREGEVCDRDIGRVIESASAVAIPADREILHVIPQEYIVDGQVGIMEPVGMCGVKLETKAHIVTGQVTAAQNLVKCVHGAGMDVADVILEQLASSEAVLMEDEKNLGVALIDCGGGTTDIAIFIGGGIRYTESVTLGGDNIDSDLAFGFSIPPTQARKIKERYGSALSSIVSPDEIIEIPSVGRRKPRKISRRDIALVIEPRMEEIFTLVKSKMRESGFEEVLPAGAVITGGTVIMDGTVELVERVLEMPVRMGIPTEIGGLGDVIANPVFSTGVGLAIHGVGYEGDKKLRIREEKTFKKILDSMKNWFKEFL